MVARHTSVKGIKKEKKPTNYGGGVKMDAILKFFGILVVGSLILSLLAALGPIGAIIIFFIIGATVLGK